LVLCRIVSEERINAYYSLASLKSLALIVVLTGSWQEPNKINLFCVASRSSGKKINVTLIVGHKYTPSQVMYACPTTMQYKRTIADADSHKQKNYNQLTNPTINYYVALRCCTEMSSQMVIYSELLQKKHFNSLKMKIAYCSTK